MVFMDRVVSVTDDLISLVGLLLLHPKLSYVKVLRQYIDNRGNPRVFRGEVNPFAPDFTILQFYGIL